MDPVVVRFTDTEWRPVYEGERCQYVIDQDGCRIGGD